MLDHNWLKQTKMTKILVVRLVFNTSRNILIVAFHFSSFRGCLVGQSYRPILCSFQLTAVSLLTIRNFLLRNLCLFVLYVCSLVIIWSWHLIKKLKTHRVHCWVILARGDFQENESRWSSGDQNPKVVGLEFESYAGQSFSALVWAHFSF